MSSWIDDEKDNQGSIERGEMYRDNSYSHNYEVKLWTLYDEM